MALPVVRRNYPVYTAPFQNNAGNARSSALLPLPPSVTALRTPLSFIAILRSSIALVAVIIGIWVQLSSSAASFRFADEWLRDRLVRMHASFVPEERVILVDIDEASLSSFGPWPWPRARLAELVEHLIGTYSARAVALDLVFPEPADHEGDARLAMLAQHGPVVLAQAFDYATRPVALRVGRLGQGSPVATPEAVAAQGFIANHAGLAEASHVSNIGVIPDPDGTLRRLPVITAFEGQHYPTLSLSLTRVAQVAPRLPDEQTGLTRIPYARTWDSYTVIPAANVLHGQAPADLLKGKLVIIGSSSLGLSDRVSTPLDPLTSGMLVHAAMTSHWLDLQQGTAPAQWPGKAIAVIFAIVATLLLMYCLSRLSAVMNACLLGGLFVGWIGLAYLIAPHDPVFSPTGPLAVLLFLMAIAVPVHWQLSQRRSRRLLGTLKQYVATAVVDELLRLDLKDPLAPRHLHVTTLIADMEGYTTHVEALHMDHAAALTRDFLGCLTRPVLECRGTLDKFTGDGLVAFWGAPLPVDDHADLALDAAQGIVREVRRFNDARETLGLSRLRVRIGIESGVAMAGDFGSASRSIYTAVGDSVNTASRLESIAKNMPHDVIIGAGTAVLAKRHALAYLGEVTLRGKEKPTRLYTLEEPT
ncbi:MAG: adenylate/guanylate cyclase protein [Paucimonas sp.]|nr:adenylate/guanylate cyclase protein [Paucimonas sp.]